MSSSALCLGIIGIGLTFIPDVISEYLIINNTKIHLLILQVLGAFYFAFAMLNWMAKGASIGGIYNRPIAIANFTHFFIGGIAIIKSVRQNTDFHFSICILAIVYSIFSLIFGLILFKSPVKKNSQ